ncbi:MAG: hypothetical protein GY719_02250 [bacterium]|nr:hypothetical protein [bacterium]
MATLSIEITGKIRSALFVLSALLEQGPTVAGLVTEMLRPSPRRGEEPAEFLAQIQALGQLLKAALDRMVELDTQLVDENQLRAALFAGREGKAAFLSQRLTGLRRIVTGCYAAPDVERLGLDGRNARESIGLLRQSELISERLRLDDLDELLGKTLFEPRLDPRPFGQQIESTSAELQEAFEAHQRSRRRVDELLARKKKAVKDYDTAFVRVARQFEDLCRLAGLDDLADKVRPSLTRQGQTAVEPEDGEVAPEGSSNSAERGDSDPPAEDAAVSATAPEPDAESDSETGGEPAAGSAPAA